MDQGNLIYCYRYSAPAIKYFMSHVNVISIPDLQKSPFFFSNLKSTLHKVDLSSLHQSKNKNSRSRGSKRFVDIFCVRMKIFKQHTHVTVLCCSLGSLLPTVTSALPPVPVCWCLCSVSALHHSASVQRGAVPGATGVTHTLHPWEPCHTDTQCHTRVVSHRYIVSHS